MPRMHQLSHLFGRQHEEGRTVCGRLRDLRLFGSKPGSGVPGNIDIENSQIHLTNINHDRLRRTLTDIRKLLGYETYDVSLVLVDDKKMLNANYESRGIDAPH